MPAKDAETEPSTSKSRVVRLREAAELDERTGLLADAPLFGVLASDDLDAIAHRFYKVRVTKGERIFREGESAERLFLLADGSVKLFVSSAAGQELTVAIAGRGEIFGELAVIDRGPRAMSARAMTDSLVYALDSDVFWTLLEDRPALARRLLELMARRLRSADQTTQDLVFFDAPTRLARCLLRLAEEHGSSEGDDQAVRIDVRLTQGDIASMIGVTRSSVNRLIASFTARGWLDWNDGHPLLLRVEDLMRRAR